MDGDGFEAGAHAAAAQLEAGGGAPHEQPKGPSPVSTGTEQVGEGDGGQGALGGMQEAHAVRGDDPFINFTGGGVMNGVSNGGTLYGVMGYTEPNTTGVASASPPQVAPPQSATQSPPATAATAPASADAPPSSGSASGGTPVQPKQSPAQQPPAARAAPVAAPQTGKAPGSVSTQPQRNSAEPTPATTAPASSAPTRDNAPTGAAAQPARRDAAELRRPQHTDLAELKVWTGKREIPSFAASEPPAERVANVSPPAGAIPTSGTHGAVAMNASHIGMPAPIFGGMGNIG